MTLHTPLATLLTLLFIVTACAKPLPNDKRQFAGHWQSTEISLLITHDGMVDYKRVEQGKVNKSVAINAPIQAFTDTGFIVGALGITTEFVVSQPPTHNNGQWTMVVDGNTLIKTDPGNET